MRYRLSHLVIYASRLLVHASHPPLAPFSLDSFHEQSSGSPPEWISCGFTDRCQSARSSPWSRAPLQINKFLERKRIRGKKPEFHGNSFMGILSWEPTSLSIIVTSSIKWTTRGATSASLIFVIVRKNVFLPRNWESSLTFTNKTCALV